MLYYVYEHIVMPLFKLGTALVTVCVCVCVCVCVILWLSVAAELRAGTGNVDHYKLRNPVQLKSFCLISERHMTCCSMSIVTSIDSVILSTTLLPQPRLI